MNYFVKGLIYFRNMNVGQPILELRTIKMLAA